MGIAQLSKQIGKSVEHELTLIFATMGDSYLPEASHTSLPLDGYDGITQHGMDASGYSSGPSASSPPTTQAH